MDMQLRSSYPWNSTTSSSPLVRRPFRDLCGQGPQEEIPSVELENEAGTPVSGGLEAVRSMGFLAETQIVRLRIVRRHQRIAWYLILETTKDKRVMLE